VARGAEKETMSKLNLEFAFTYRLQVRGPLQSKDGSPVDERRQYWEMASATLEGPRIHASTPVSGIDWFTPIGNGYGRPHVRLPLHTDDGALVLLEYNGVVHATEQFNRAVANDTSTDWDDQYMRMALTFDTASERYAWLTQHLFIARGRLLGAKDIEYEVFQLV